MQIAAKPKLMPTCETQHSSLFRRLYENIFYNYYRLQHW